MIRINLISEGKKAPAVRSARLRAFNLDAQNIAVFCVIAGLRAGAARLRRLLAVHRTRQLKRQQAGRSRSSKRRSRSSKEIIKEVERFEKRKVELQHKIQVITELRNNQRGPVHIMDQVSRSLPDFLWLDRMDMSASAVTLEGKAFTTSSVANFIENLDGVPGVPGAGAPRTRPGAVRSTTSRSPSTTRRCPVARTPEGCGGRRRRRPGRRAPPSAAGQEAAAR